MNDIETEADVALFVERFYARVRQDSELGFIFDDVAHVNWPEHLPRITAFWSTMLLNTGTYAGNPMRPHLDLALKTPIRPEHFDRWLFLFSQTMTATFSGPRADEARQRAHGIATVIQSRLYSSGLLVVDET